LSLCDFWFFSIFKNPARQISKKIEKNNILDKLHKVGGKRQMRAEN
jgi:hypothetical protein